MDLEPQRNLKAYRGEELLDNGEGVLGDRLGDPEAQAISGRLPL